jgi:EAL domain-containing protein (putative c-di-GMP-specific phosphodiesterase class I)
MEPGAPDPTTARLHRLQRDLRGINDRSELQLDYQPVVEITTGRTVGAEALVRWRHPTLGLLGPAEFLRPAEESGEIVPIGVWVLRTACAEAARWPYGSGDAPLGVSVNLSPVEVAHPRLLEHVRAALQVGGLDPPRLTLEVTGTLVLRDLERAVPVVGELGDLGVRLAVDSFGTGYSSIGDMRRFRIDELKIDRTLVKGLVDCADDAAIIRLIVRLAQELKLTSTAKGVETPDQRDQLERLGCDRGQGYLWAPPLTAAELRVWLNARGPAA